jgi:hypothetical protein
MATADDVIYNMSTQSEGSPAVFTKKDWLSILDNQNQNYQGNQSVIDTSQLANSNKYINYREAYVTIPLLLTATSPINATAPQFSPATSTVSADYAVGLKNWYGSVIHSFTCDYNGTTIIQQTPYIGLWNTFKLMTSLSQDDLVTQGSAIGFFPDTATSAGFTAATSGVDGVGTANNHNAPPFIKQSLVGQQNSFTSLNSGLFERQQAWNFDFDGISPSGTAAYSTLASTSNFNLLWKSYIITKINASSTVPGVWQCAITAQVYLKHLHSFFERIPLLKGVFMKLTMNLNQSSVSFTSASTGSSTVPGNVTFSAVTVQSPLGGVSPIMLANGSAQTVDLSGSVVTLGQGGSVWGSSTGNIVSLAVGKTCLNTSQSALAGVGSSPLSGSILLNVPAYSFNPVFEASYLSSPVKKIVYTDVYQYQVLNVPSNQVFNNLVTNGIANIKSVLVLPFYTSTANQGLLPFQSPFDPAGGGPTSPLCLMTQFNIQISGQNAIYNTERYEYEQFLNQFKGVNAINGGQEDGSTSGLVGQLDFDMEYCYYYVNCGRMLPVEEAVPKSINILGTNTSLKAIDMYIFVEYGVEVNVDILTGARV